MNRILNIICVIFFSIAAYAQTDSVYFGDKDKTKKAREKKEKKDSRFRDKLLYGGNLNVFFINRTTVVNLNPSIGYKITEKFHAGAGFMLTYFSSRLYSQRFNTLFYGPHIYTRFFIVDGIYIQAQYDRLYQPLYNYNQGIFEKGWMDYYMAGGGFMKPIGKRAYIITSIMYNFNYKANQPSAYFNPLVQFGVVGTL